jgi:hypothetical protein
VECALRAHYCHRPQLSFGVKRLSGLQSIAGYLMLKTRACVALVVLAVACSSHPISPSATVRVDVALDASTVRVGDVVALTLVATNASDREARWSSGCGSDLGFEVRDSNGRVVEAPEFGVCSLEARRLTLGPREVMTRTATWRVGAATRPGSPGATGLVTVHGRLGFLDAPQRPGSTASVRVAP